MTPVIYQEPYPAATRGNRWGIKGPKYGPDGHRGQDWAPGDVPGLALADGIVVINQWSDFLGWVVELRHADGMYTGLAHLATRATARIGDSVSRHRSVGAHLGDTGSAAMGRHAHYTVSDHQGGIFSGKTFDPLKWIADHDQPAAPAKKPASSRKSTTARKDEGLSSIAERSGLTLPAIQKLNPQIKPPRYVVQLGQKVWIS